jgi:hypothetical protein
MEVSGQLHDSTSFTQGRGTRCPLDGRLGVLQIRSERRREDTNLFITSGKRTPIPQPSSFTCHFHVIILSTLRQTLAYSAAPNSFLDWSSLWNFPRIPVILQISQCYETVRGFNLILFCDFHKFCSVVYLWNDIDKSNLIHEEIRSRLNLDNACCHWVQNLLLFSSSV